MGRHVPRAGEDALHATCEGFDSLSVQIIKHLHCSASISLSKELAFYKKPRHSTLHRCCEFTGDTDTVAAIAMAAASQCQEIDPEIPDVLFETLENGTYGRDYLIKVGRELEEKFSTIFKFIRGP